jgi:hypothetical protein
MIEAARRGNAGGRMAVQTVMIGGQPILVEVVDEAQGDQLPAGGASAAPLGTPSVAAGRAGDGHRDQVRFQEVSLSGDAIEAARRMESSLRAVIEPIQRAGQGLGVSEWTVELSFGFKGSAGIPFVVNGEANGAVKVSAKWKNE